jgi:hypothetical protein
MQREDMKELDAYPDVAPALPDALAAASPHRLPPELRARVLRAAEVRAGRTARRFGARSAMRLFAAGLALVLIVGLTLWNVQLQQALAQDRNLLQQLRERAGREPLIFDIVDSSQSQKVMLRAAGPRRPGEDPPYGKLYTNPSFTQIIVMAGRLPAAPADQEYRLYLASTSGASTPVGTLSLDATGFGYLVYDTGAKGTSYSAARLYLQPKGDTPADGVLVLSWEAR